MPEPIWATATETSAKAMTTISNPSIRLFVSIALFTPVFEYRKQGLSRLVRSVLLLDSPAATMDDYSGLGFTLKRELVWLLFLAKLS
jgi:hypothetical protein